MIAEKNGITVDTRTAAPARKMIKCPQKTGINLNLQEDRQRDRRTLLIGILAIAALVTVVVNFGVLQQYRRLDKAQAAYDRVHTQYVSAQEALADYDRVLLEYRTYSMEWATDGSEDNGTLVDRQKALDLLEICGLREQADVAARQTKHLLDAGNGAHMINIINGRVIHIHIALRDQKNALVFLHGLIERRNGFLAPRIKMQNHMREDHQPAQRQHRQADRLRVFLFRLSQCLFPPLSALFS